MLQKMAVNFYVMRHVETENNAAFRIACETGDESYLKKLEAANRPDACDRGTRRGVKNVKIVSQWIQERILKEGPIHAYFVSDMVRTQETAVHLDLPGVRWQESPFLHERDWGAFFRKSPDQQEEHSDSFARRDQDPWHWRPERGVTLAEGLPSTYLLMKEELQPYEGKNVFCISHGERMWKIRFVLEGMSALEFKAVHLAGNEEDKIHNCTIHHYSRRNPHTNEIEARLGWMRVVTPYLSPEPSEWRQIGRKTYSSADLQRRVDEHHHILEF